MEFGQLRLIPAPQPLVERLGTDFFRAIPRAPGVYRMYDGEDRLVYVGKALDLRSRLDSYRRTAGQSRKTIRLIHAVRRIEWEVCESETAARLMENELIRRLRPRFNRAGTWPKSARYIRVEESGAGLRLRLVQDMEEGGPCHGPFRGGPGWALAALGRLLWLAWSGGGVRELPRHMFWGESVKVLELNHPQWVVWLEDLHGYLAGRDDRLVGRLVRALPDAEDRFGQAYIGRQFAVVEDFFRRGPLRNRRLRERFGVESEGEVLTPERLDDWVIVGGREAVAPAFRPEEDGQIPVGQLP